MSQEQVAVEQHLHPTDVMERAAPSVKLLAVQERIMRTAARGYGLQSAFELVARELDQLVGHDCAALLTWRDEQRNLCIEAVAGDHDGLLEPGMQVPVSEVAMDLATGRLEAAICSDTRVSSNWLERRLGQAGILSCAILPVKTQGRERKLLVLASRCSDQYSLQSIVQLQGLTEAILASLWNYWLQGGQSPSQGHYADDAGIREQQRLVAEVSRGVVHSLNNIFASLLGNLQLLQEKVKPAAAAQRLEQMERSVLRGTAILHALDQFSASGTVRDHQVFDLASVAQEVIDLTRVVWRRGAGDGKAITVKHQQQPGIAVHANYAEIKEALINIFFNALQVLPQGGEIVVNEGYDQDLAFVEVADNGVGMGEETRRRATEPFFTTRGSGHHGLGLSVASGIAHRHGGYISILSEPGPGALVRLSVGLLGLEEAA